jgi:hypothetical protein
MGGLNDVSNGAGPASVGWSCFARLLSPRPRWSICHDQARRPLASRRFVPRWGLPTPQGNALGGADFEDATTGFAVGPRGTVLATDDGGVTWTPRELFPGFSPDLEDVLVIGPGEVLAVGSSPGIFRSTDAGASWTAVPRTPRRCSFRGAHLQLPTMLWSKRTWSM